MKNNPYDRFALAQAGLELAPPLIRKTLLEESAFLKEYGFKIDPFLTFDDSGVSIQRSKLFDSIRKILSSTPETEITDSDGRKWKLNNKSKKEELPTLVLTCGEQSLELPDFFAAFYPDSIIRLRLLASINLPASARDTWRNILSERTLEDDEIDELRDDFLDTPAYVAGLIHDELVQGLARVPSFVPPSQRYFARLVGDYDGSVYIGDYAAGRGRQFFKQLSAQQPYEGFLLSLFLSSHSALTNEISVEHLEKETLVRAFRYLEKSGDRISQLGAIEVGLRILPERPEIEQIIINLIKQIRDDDVDGPTSGFKLLSALFVLVDGELSRLRLLPEEPPFYRRLASLSQSALIHCQIINSGIKLDSFCKWALEKGGKHYYLQSFADMRLEPRWNPELATALQMKEDFFGRIMNAARKHEKNINGSELHNLILGTEHRSLYSLSEFPYPYFPGPLEGTENSPNTLPAEISEDIEKQINEKEIGPSSFTSLVNSSLLFRIGPDHAELAARALKIGHHRLVNVEDKSQLLAILHGLATISATARSCTLADELLILVRKYRRDPQYALSIEDILRICLITAASRAELNDWKKFTGDLLTELAFGDLKDNDGTVLHSYLQCLCHVVPELRVTCGRADAALEAFNASRPMGKN